MMKGGRWRVESGGWRGESEEGTGGEGGEGTGGEGGEGTGESGEGREERCSKL